MRDYLPTKRGFAIGVALWAAIAAQGCFPKFDDARMRINPETGETIVERVKGAIPKPGDDAFVGPVDPATDQTFSAGKAAAKADFNQSVKVLTWWACAACVVGGAFMLVASFFLPWASTKLAAYCLAGAGLTLIVRYVLLTYGTITADIAFWIMVATAVGAGALVGLPALIAYTRRIDWKNGKALALEPGKEREGVAILARASAEVNEVRGDVAEWLKTFNAGDKASAAWSEAEQKLKMLGVLKVGGK